MSELKHKTIIDKQGDRVYIRNMHIGHLSILGMIARIHNTMSCIKEVLFHKCYLNMNIDIIGEVKEANELYPDTKIKYYSDCEIIPSEY